MIKFEIDKLFIDFVLNVGWLSISQSIMKCDLWNLGVGSFTEYNTLDPLHYRGAWHFSFLPVFAQYDMVFLPTPGRGAGTHSQSPPSYLPIYLSNVDLLKVHIPSIIRELIVGTDSGSSVPSSGSSTHISASSSSSLWTSSLRVSSVTPVCCWGDCNIKRLKITTLNQY